MTGVLSDADLAVPFCVAPGWRHSEMIENFDGPTYRLLFWSWSQAVAQVVAEIGFEHRCDRGERGVIICAPRLSLGHRVAWTDQADGRRVPTVDPSILCPDCGTHGFIRAGRWAAS